MIFMIKKAVAAVLIAVSVSAVAGDSACSLDHFPNKVQPVTKQQTQLVCLDGFSVGYSNKHKTPLWSSEMVDVQGLNGKVKRHDSFHPEQKVKPEFRATNKDYDEVPGAAESYDRGHLTPYRNRPFSADIDSLANMAPQVSQFNRGAWNLLEIKVRKDLLSAGQVPVWIVTGVIQQDKNYIGNRVYVPTHYYKAVFGPDYRKAWIAENKKNSIPEEVSIADLEQMAGISFSGSKKIK